MGLQDAENRLNRADYTNQQLQMYNKQITTSVENLSDISTQALGRSTFNLGSWRIWRYLCSVFFSGIGGFLP